jgi:hypothetical protein
MEGPNPAWGEGEDVITNLLGAPWGATQARKAVPEGETPEEKTVRVQKICDDANRPVHPHPLDPIENEYQSKTFWR